MGNRTAGQPTRRKGPAPIAPAVRFWRHVGPPAMLSDYAPHLGPCWPWIGAIGTGHGYGNFGVSASCTKEAHRFAYELLVGPIPKGLDLDHLCRVRCCVNPAHLEPVTRAVNLRRGKALITHCPQGHAYDEMNTYLDRAGKRHCRACMTRRARERTRIRQLRSNPCH